MYCFLAKYLWENEWGSGITRVIHRAIVILHENHRYCKVLQNYQTFAGSLKTVWVAQLQKTGVRVKPAVLKYLTGPWGPCYDQG